MSARSILLAAALSAVAFGVPLEERQSCGKQWDQCGGANYNGPTCCAAGSTCVAQNQWYSQCLPGSQPGNPNPATSSSTTAPRPTSSVPRPTSSVPTTVQTSQGPATTARPTTTRGSDTPGGTASYSGNPFSGVQMWANDYYASEITSLAMPSLAPTLAAKAANVAKVPTFEWFDIAAKVPTRLAKSLADIRAANKAGANPPYAGLFVVYDLPDRDCAAAASNGEYSIANGGVANYKKYIDSIRAQLLAYPDVRSLLVIEPDSLANMITNLNVPKCAGAEAAYHECTQYAIKNLDLPNVAMYLDAGHAGWLGWEKNLPPAAQMYAKLYNEAGKPKALRGLATNVANYNGWNLTTAPAYTQGNAIFDEQRYVKALHPLLKAAGWDAHFITDQGRSGRQPTGQNEWGDWCNQKGTGFGMRPTANTGLDIQDAFVWIKPGGECDGTSDQSAARYDFHCGAASALKPAPEAGQWFQAYFEQLLVNANPAF